MVVLVIGMAAPAFAVTTKTYTIGTRTLNINITSVSGSGPWTLQLASASLANVAVNDKVTDEAATPKSWKVTAINDASDTLTVTDSESNGGSPSAAGSTQATVARWYTTLQGWEDDRDGDLVTRDTVEKGEMYNDSTFTGTIEIDGSTTNSTHYMWLTAAVGHRHTGIAGTGVKMDPSGGCLNSAILIEDSYTKVEWIEVTGYQACGGTQGIRVKTAISGFEINQVIVHDPDNDPVQDLGLMYVEDGGSGTIRNSVFYNPSTTVPGIGLYVGGTGASTVNVYNCVVYNIPAFYGIGGDTGHTVNAINNIGMAANWSGFGYNFSGTTDYNMSDDTSATDRAGAGHSLSSKTASNQFVSLTSGSQDFHLKSGADALGAGKDLSSDFAIDIDYGVRPRPVGGAWDIGADERALNTEIRLASFEALRDGGMVRLRWRTGLEVDNLGFHVYREEGGRLVPVTRSLVAGSALFAGGGTTLASGNSYGWLDRKATGSGRYWLEEVGLNGKTELHGPVVAGASPSGVGVQRSALIVGLGQRQEAFVGVGRRVGWRELTLQRDAGATRPRVKLKVRDEGWYRVGLAELAHAGLSADPETFRLEADGESQALALVGDAIEFYGIGADTPWTDERTYFVSAAASGEDVRRIARISGAGGDAAAAESFPFTVERRDKAIYFAALKNGEDDNFFGPAVSEKTLELAMSVRQLAGAGTSPLLHVELQGVTDLPHRVAVVVNRVEMGVISFDGQKHAAWETVLPPASLVEGENKVTLSSRAGPTDVSLLDVVRLTYQRRYQAEGDVLRFGVPKGQSVSVHGFSRSSIRSFDVTDATAPVELLGMVAAEGGGYALTLGPASGAREILALTAEQAREPATLEARSAQSGTIESGVDMVILSHAAFLNAVKPLAERRRQEGFSVAVVDVEDVYDGFGFGQKSPHALRSFFQEASRAGTRYALLVGDATFDPRNHLGMGAFDLVPTKLVESRMLETASDDWLADFDGDGLADMAIGRLPVRTAVEATTIVEKLLRHEVPRTPGGVLVLSGKTGDDDFAGTAVNLIAGWPDEMRARHVRLDALGPDGARKELAAFVKDDGGIVEYLGHGSVEVWADGLLERANASSLKGKPSVFVPLTCLNGFFHDVYTESLAETLLKVSEGGALAVWASSGLTNSDDQIVLGKEFAQRLMADGATLGDAARAAKAFATPDVRRTWILLGDPSVRLRLRLPIESEAAALAPAPPAIDVPSPPPAIAPALASLRISSSGCACEAGREAPASSWILLAIAVFLVRSGRRRR